MALHVDEGRVRAKTVIIAPGCPLYGATDNDGEKF